jgi:hypothetical protein
LIRENARSGLVDIMLMSASTAELLVMRERMFDDLSVTPAARANDTTDIFVASGGNYPQQPSRPFRTATIDHMMCGKAHCEPAERKLGVDLGLYSMTFNNDVQLDREALETYRQFRVEAEAKGFRHFLEVFDPNAPLKPIDGDVGRFVADMVTRALAGVTSAGRPVFLKLVYHGPAVMEALSGYDRHLVPGILGGSSGTTYDAFHMLWEARKYGARAALYGRKINSAEHQLSFIRYLRAIADGQIAPDEAVRAYHGDLQRLGISPYRSLEDDMQLTGQVSSYGATASGRRARAVVDGAAGVRTSVDQQEKSHNQINNRGEPDFVKMSTSEKVAWNRARWSRILG